MNTSNLLLRYIYISVFTIFIFSFGYGQERQVNNRLNEILISVRAGKAVSVDESIFYKQQNQSIAITGVKKWITDTLPDVRLYASRIANRIGQASTDKDIRQQAVNLLLKLCEDADTRVTNLAGESLKSYFYLDFDKNAQDIIINYIIHKTYGYSNILKVAGYLNLPGIQEHIKEKISSGSLSRKEKLAAYLALARLGDAEAVDYCLNKVRTLGINNDVVDDVLPDLIYTRQRKCYDYLIEILNNNELSCESPNPDASGKILCGYRIMEYLAPVIEKFPFKTNISGDIITDNYRSALKQTREWFKKNPDYKIKTDKF
jgi:hypothetical protein